MKEEGDAATPSAIGIRRWSSPPQAGHLKHSRLQNLLGRQNRARVFGDTGRNLFSTRTLLQTHS
jgi:hypothetical protein